MVISCYISDATEIRFLHIFSSLVWHFFQQRRQWVSCQLPDADTRPGNRFHAPMFVYILNVNTEQSGDGDWDKPGHDGMSSDKRTFSLCSPGHGNWWGIWNTQWSRQRRTPSQSPGRSAWWRPQFWSQLSQLNNLCLANNFTILQCP